MQVFECSYVLDPSDYYCRLGLLLNKMEKYTAPKYSGGEESQPLTTNPLKPSANKRSETNDS